MKISVQRNLAYLSPQPDQPIDLAAVPQAVRQAGFKPGEMHLVAWGTFSGVAPDVRFQIRGWPHGIPVRAAGPLPQGENRVSARVEYSEELVLVPEPNQPDTENR